MELDADDIEIYLNPHNRPAILLHRQKEPVRMMVSRLEHVTDGKRRRRREYETLVGPNVFLVGKLDPEDDPLEGNQECWIGMMEFSVRDFDHYWRPLYRGLGEMRVPHKAIDAARFWLKMIDENYISNSAFRMLNEISHPTVARRGTKPMAIQPRRGTNEKPKKAALITPRRKPIIQPKKRS